jgi:hypothetical protein
MKKEDVVLNTKLSAEECIKILRENADMLSFSSYFASSGTKFGGVIRGNEFELYKKYPRNAFKTPPNLKPFHFNGRFFQEQNRTTIKGHFGVHVAIKFWLLIWVGVLGTWLFNSISATTDVSFDYSNLFIYCVFGLFIVIFIQLTLVRYHKKIIIDFLRDKLEAK